MGEQVPLDPDARADLKDGKLHVVLDDIAYRRLAIVNVIFYGIEGAGDRKWVLIDAGIMGSEGAIVQAARDRFGDDSRPAAIVMTHGHFDHVGALEGLSERWDVPVYAHSSELPYLNGSESYRPPDPSVGGGMMARLSGLYPRGPVDVGERLEALPVTGEVPFMPGWRWLHTPGHTRGHVSLWRETDRTVIAGDAFITTNQESAYAVMRQEPELHGPPQYFTPDWQAAKRSVEILADLQPETAITGHGNAMAGAHLRDGLKKLAARFDDLAIPEQGRYVD